jgi:adenosylcobinamide-GDP ribazoletransferase
MAVTWQAASPKGMFATIHEASSRGAVRAIAAVAFVVADAAMIARGPLGGALALVAALGIAAWLKRFSAREFGGMSGDLLGFYVQSSELAMLAALVVAGRVA